MNEKKYTITIKESQNGTRIDKLCGIVCPDFSRSAWAARGVFVLDGVVKNYKSKVKTGEIWDVKCEEKEGLSGDLIPWDFPLKVIAEGDDWVVIEKPVGVSMHPSPSDPGQETIVNALVSQFAKLSQKTDQIDGETVPRPGLVHRLDKITSGVVLVAKTDKAHKFFQDNWKDVKKVYHALVKGTPSPTGEVNSPIGRSPKDRKRMACVTGGKPSLTQFTTLKKAKGYAEMEVEIKTGRTHQIRVHLSAIGCPIVGDALYRGVEAPRVMLHAKQLEFTTPSGERIIAKSEIPAPFGVFWAELAKGLTEKAEVKTGEEMNETPEEKA